MCHVNNIATAVRLRDNGRASGGGFDTDAVNCSFSFMCWLSCRGQTWHWACFGTSHLWNSKRVGQKMNVHWPRTAPVWGFERPHWTTMYSLSGNGRDYWEGCDRPQLTVASLHADHDLNTHGSNSFMIEDLSKIWIRRVKKHNWPSGVQTRRTARKSCRLLSRTYLTLKCSFTETVLGQLAVMTKRGRSRRILGNLMEKGTKKFPAIC